MKKFRRTKLPKFRLGAENFVRRKILSAEILSDKVFRVSLKKLDINLFFVQPNFASFSNQGQLVLFLNTVGPVPIYNQYSQILRNVCIVYNDIYSELEIL